jgi:hypothetical protein
VAKSISATTSRMLNKTAAIVLGTALMTGGLILTAASAQASPGTLALCVEKTHKTFDSPVDPGATNEVQSHTLEGDGTISCLDAQENVLRRGTVHVRITLPHIQCVGHEEDATIVDTITWRDGNVSTLNLGQDSNIENGVQNTGTAHGSVTADSGRFPNATVTAVASIVPHGCGTPEGETDSDTEVVLTFTSV